MEGLPPEAQAAIGVSAIAAVVAAAPLIAQAIGGAIIAGLGSALAGVGILGAVLSGKLTKPFDDFVKQAKLDLISIGAAFVPVITNILGVAGTVLGQLTPIFAAAMGIIAGPFKLFADTILKSFTQPAVQSSITNVANAFGKILTAFTPAIPGIVQGFANAITQIANAVSKNPKAFADFLTFLADIVIYTLKAIGFLTEIAVWIQNHWDIIKWLVSPVADAVMLVSQHFNWMRHDTADIFDGIRHDISHVWDMIHDDTIGRIVHINQDVQTHLNEMFHDIASIFDQARHDIAHDWDVIWSDTIGTVTHGITNVIVAVPGVASPHYHRAR